MASASECNIEEGRSSNFSECSWSSSVSDNGGDFTGINSRRSPKWKKLMKKLVQRLSFHGSSKPALTFRYDPVSYSLNFDDGNLHIDQEYYSYGSRFSSQDLDQCS